MDEQIPFARPHLGKEEEEAVLGVLKSGWLTTGNECINFEKEFSQFLTSRLKEKNNLTCLAVNSATSGLHLALEASGIGPGDLVLLPSYTFTATAEVIRYLGADPVFVDINNYNFNIRTQELIKKIETLPAGRAKAIMPVHFGGLPCDMAEIKSIADKYNLKVIEDAAHSFPSVLPAGNKIEEGTMAGTAGDIGVFSFYVTKTMTTGEGGMIVTGNPEYVKRISVMRSHGIDRSIWNRYTETGASWYYEVIELGYKYNLPDLLASLGRVQLKKSLYLLESRNKIAQIYDNAFGDNEFLTIPPTGYGDARHLYPIKLNTEKLKTDRNTFIEKLKENGIGASVHFIPLHIMPYYKNRYNLKANDYPQSLSAYNREISLPIWPGLTEGMTEKIITVVKKLIIKYT